jgi:osmotically-inducible protein OsmY
VYDSEQTPAGGVATVGAWVTNQRGLVVQTLIAVGHCSSPPRKFTMSNIQARIATVLLCTSVVFGFVGYSSTPTQESTGQYLDDTAITAKVKAAIFNDPTVSSAEINVETFKGTVQLSGFVQSADHMAKAVKLTQAVHGVRAVRNDMRVK